MAWKDCFVVIALWLSACGGTGSGSPSQNTGGDGGSGGTIGSGGSGGGSQTEPQTPGGYHAQGNRILDANGNVYHFHGISRPSLEWAPAGEFLFEQDYENMKSWGANVVRIPLNQVFWREYSAYRLIVDEQVEWCKKHGMDVILDLHWSEGANAGQGAQRVMPDGNSLSFWVEVAGVYKNDSRVLFELYNEPHSVSWDVWKNGGSAAGFQAVGMQTLVDAIRATGADNLVIAGGLDYAYDLKGVLTGYALSGTNIVYATHPYDYPNKMPNNWENDWGRVADQYPVIVTEFGRHASKSCDPTYYTQVIDYANGKGAGWVGWAWYVATDPCTFPSLIADWDGTPTQPGTAVRAGLQSFGGR